MFTLNEQHQCTSSHIGWKIINGRKDSAQLLNSAYDCHGWPGPDVIGTDCEFAIYFLAANAVYDAPFQSRTISLMGESLPKGGYYANCHAQLLDRYLTLSQKPTIYGNSFGSYYNDNGERELLTFEVVDPENLDKRRATVGHTSLHTEQERCVQDAKSENWKLPTREQSIIELNQVSIAGGYL